MIYDIRKYGDQVLREDSLKVEKIDNDILTILEDMAETMRAAKGVGLAAPQIGINKRLLVIDKGDGIIRKIINPEILEYSKESIDMEEGCLSIPGIYKKVRRPEGIKVRYTNERKEEVIEEADGFLARIFQHENDHLNSVLFVDKLSPVAKRMVAKKLQLMKKESLKKK